MSFGASLRKTAATRRLALSPASKLCAGALGSVLLCSLLWACSPAKVSLVEGAREYVASDYEAALKRWTRTGQLTSIAEMDNVFTSTATYEGWDFRWAYTVHYAEDYRLTVDQRHALLEHSLAETREAHLFYLALYSQRYKWNDLTAPSPAWIVRL